MTILLLFAFISGLITILAPCIWPLLPIILSTSLQGGKSKSFGITLGIMLSFAFFTLSISYLVSLFGLDPNILRIAAIVVLIMLGIMMISPRFGQLIEAGVSRFSGRLGQGGSRRNGFWGGFVTGLSLGIVWTPCAGPILAAIATLSATSRVNLEIILVTGVYVLGVGIPLFFFSYGGQTIFRKIRFVSSYTGRIQQIFGGVLLVTAFLIATNYDKVLQAKLLDAFPSYTNFVVQLESQPGVKKELDKLQGKESRIDSTSQAAVLFNEKYDAPPLKGITSWLNTPNALSLDDLKGKVVLVDFWTYTCINCIRTLPYVTKWYETYKDEGFIVIGVHTPEFAFEKETANVEGAVKQFKIHYPVAQDNDYATWNSYDNHYWPAKYLIDAQGVVRRTHFGEGKYEEMEMAIQALLKEKGATVSTTVSKLPNETPKGPLTPETYLGSQRRDRLANTEFILTNKQTFTLPSYIPLHAFAFSGEWELQPEYAVSSKNARLDFSFYAGKVFAVMTPSGGDDVTVLLDGYPLGDQLAGKDVKDSKVQFDSPRLYELVDLHGKKGSFTLQLVFGKAGTKLFAFTFGE